MSGFIRNFRSFVGEVVAGFRVCDISGEVRPNRDKSPNYDVQCLTCKQSCIMSQTQLANAANGAITLCPNHTCASRVRRSEGETLSQIRAKEKAAEREAQRKAAEARERSAQRAAKDAAEHTALEPFRADWHEYCLFQIQQNVPTADILNFQRWLSIGDQARTRIMQAVRQSSE